MAKVKVYSIDKKERIRIIKELLFVISELKSKNDIADFFLGILTQSEVVMVARRLQIAKMLLADESYDSIGRKMHVSHQTVNKTEQWIRHNSNAGNTIIKKIKSINVDDEIETEREYSMLDKYSHHRILKDLLGL
jgi:uncharacterized protein YerC